MAIMKTTQICTDICNDHSEDIFMQNLQFIIPDHYNCILALLIGVHQPDVLGHEGNQRYLRGYVDWIRVVSKSYDLSSQCRSIWSFTGNGRVVLKSGVHLMVQKQRWQSNQQSTKSKCFDMKCRCWLTSIRGVSSFILSNHHT